MSNLVGVMQGRLLPKYEGRYQAHPIGYWQDEFFIAKKADLNSIEFILDYNDAETNPLLVKDGISQIRKVIEKTGILVKTICADYFMEAPLHSKDNDVANKSKNTLRKLLENAQLLGVTDIVIPCVDQSSLSGTEETARFVEALSPLVALADKVNINLSLETDLAPDIFVELLSKFDSTRVTVNYDIGNSASLGFNPIEELDAYGERITDIHIKDRVLNGGPVMLGQGDADFDLFFSRLKEINYCGPFIMQAYRDDEGVEIFMKQLEWIRPLIEKLN